MLEVVKKKISEGNLRVDDFIPLLEAAYRVEAVTDVAEETFRDEIRTRVPQFFDQIIGASAGQRFISEVLIPKPMRSLRDVDEPIVIELDTAGTNWTERSR